MNRESKIKVGFCIAAGFIVFLLLLVLFGFTVATGYKSDELSTFTNMGLQKERAAFINLADNGYKVEPEGLLEGAEKAAQEELGMIGIISPALVRYRAYSDLLWSSVWNGTGFIINHDNKTIIFNPVRD